ncbi:tetratricopeptide repeat protein [Sediminitomix flava]|uniref:Tetratricopeptide repeat protein n=1 Tax=Sediminitomix flava TaxID=379075 RepID=A0A315ZEW9_SEDFL|nr:tetratricopeptide repeat protein [Sediminitomix flava]PWJ43713.1 tetratricopeptide repeat protein [Sediminitomix flava]
MAATHKIFLPFLLKQQNHTTILRSIQTLLLYIIVSSPLWANSLDSLKHELSKTVEIEDRAKLLYELSQVYFKSDLDMSLNYLEEGILLLSQEPNSELLGEFYKNRGNVYLTKGFLINAKESYLQAEKIFTELGASKLRIRTQINLALLGQREKQFEKSEKEFLRLIKELEKMDDTFSEKYLPHIYLNLGALYDNTDNPQKAIQSLYTALNYCKGGVQDNLRGKVLHNMAIQYLKLGRLDDALNSIEEAYDIKQKTNDRGGVVNSLNILGNIHRLKGDFDIALPIYEVALEKAEELNSPTHMKDTYNNLYVYYEEVKEFENAIFYLKKYKEYSDLLLSETYEIQLERFEEQHELELARQELIDEKQNQQYVIIGLSVLMSLILIVCYLIFRYYRLNLKHQKAKTIQYQTEVELTQSEQEKIKVINEKLQADISFRDRELTTNIMHLMQKYELINSVSENIVALYDQVDAKTKKALRSIVFNLQNDKQGDVWKELEVRFEQVNQDFYDQLNTHYPKLTPNEKKLCAYLYLNLSTKDISSITHQSTKSIEVARFRLRKKLGLTNTDTDYQTFFKNLLSQE